jgi:hypothetical protein
MNFGTITLVAQIYSLVTLPAPARLQPRPPLLPPTPTLTVAAVYSPPRPGLIRCLADDALADSNSPPVYPLPPPSRFSLYGWR